MAVPPGSTRTVYVPVTGIVIESMNPVEPPQRLAEPSVVPSGFRIEVVSEMQPVYVEFVSVRLICCPAVPLKV